MNKIEFDESRYFHLDVTEYIFLYIFMHIQTCTKSKYMFY